MNLWQLSENRVWQKLLRYFTERCATASCILNLTQDSDFPRSLGTNCAAVSVNMMRKVNCIICKTDNHTPIYEIGASRVVKCNQCSLVYVNPRPSDEEVRSIYKGDYFTSAQPRSLGYVDYFKQHKNYIKTFEKRLKIIERFKERGSLCDIGCASGFFLKAALKSGWKVCGIEMSAQAVDHAREQGLSDLICCDFSNEFEATNYAGRFDVLTMWDYIEHSLNPERDLMKAYDMIKEDGLLIIETQNIGSLIAKVMGRRWWHLVKVQEHLYHFSPKTISMLLGKSGFRVIHVTRKYCGKFVDFNFLVERSELLGRRFHGFLSFLLTPIRDASIYVNPLDEMIIVAKKEKT